MLKGIGTDLVEIGRIKQAVNHQPRFPQSVLTAREMDLWQRMTSEKRRLEFLAGRWAAKEAFAKALGTGLVGEVQFTAIEILPGKSGQPQVTKTPYEGKCYVSITHTDHYAQAMVVLS